jgi:hypothetical protein
LAKCFKFFDIQNKGEVNFDNFYRAVEKIGVIIEKNVRLYLLDNGICRTAKKSSDTSIRMEMACLITKSSLVVFMAPILSSLRGHTSRLLKDPLAQSPLVRIQPS